MKFSSRFLAVLLIFLFLISILVISINLENVNLAPQNQETQSVTVGFGPNIASDLVSLFSNPSQWSVGLAGIDYIKLYMDNMDVLGCTSCGANTFNNLRAAGFFDELILRNKGLMVEVPVFKADFCTYASSIGTTPELLAFSRIQSSFQIWRNVRAVPNEIVIDEPLIGGTNVVAGQTCGYSFQQTIERTKSFANLVDNLFLISSNPTKIGLVEAYPNPYAINTFGDPLASATLIQNFVDGLIAEGWKPDFFQLDVNRDAIQAYGLNINQDLVILEDFFESKDIRFDVIINANDYAGYTATNNLGYYTSTYNWAQQLKNILGKAPSGLLVQSWHNLGSSPGTLPSNLPQTTPYTHTYLLNQVLSLFWITVDTVPPTAPTNLRNLAYENNQGFISWRVDWDSATDNGDIKNYVLDVSTSPSFATFTSWINYNANQVNNVIRNFNVGSGNSYLFDYGLGIPPLTTYYFRMRAIDSSGNIGPYSDTSSFVVPAPNLNSPSGLAPRLMHSPNSPPFYYPNHRVRLVWKDNSNNEAFFQLQVANNPSTGFVPVQGTSQVTANSQSYEYFQVIPAGNYYYRIRACYDLAQSHCTPWQYSQALHIV